MPLVTSVQAAAVEVFWKYRLESIQSIRLGTKLTKPNMDSDAILEGIQNEGLVDVKFLPAAERIDLYYRSLNEAGRGPVVNIVPTTDLFLLNNSIEKRTTDLFMRGASVLTLRAGMILRVEDEMVIVEGHVLLNRTQLYERITAFWYLNEDGGDRVNISANNALKDFTENLVTSQDGPQSGTKAAYFTGSIAEPQALSVKYDARLSLGDTDNNDGFTFSCWVRLQDNTVDRAVISRLGSVDGGRREFQLQYNSSQNRFEALMIKSDFGVETVHTLTHSAGIFTNTWYFLCCWFDPTARRLYLFINNSTENIVIPVAGAIPHVSIPTTVGAQLVEESADTANLMISNPWNGRIANVGFWKRVLTGTERASLFRDYTLDSIPAAHVILEDRGAHGTEAVAHDVDAVITRMLPTVPHNSVVMDALADKGIPDAPESFFCAPSGDDAEIGVAAVVAPPMNNRKTLKRLQIQAKTAPFFPSNIEYTTGSKLILEGPHVGEVKQGGNELITSTDLSSVAAPFHLYTYEDIDVDTGSITSAYAYTIDIIEVIAGTSNWRIQINEKFVASRGIFGNSRDVNFLVVRGWLDAPRDYVVNDVPLVTPPAGDSYSHEPFQQFYKTTLDVYLRARYTNRDGAGPWIYWDGVNGSVDRTRAVLFSPAGLPDVAVGREALQLTVDIEVRPVDHNTIEWSAGSIAYGDGTIQNITATGSPHTFSDLEYVYKRFNSSTLRFTSSFQSAVGDDRVLLGQIIAEDAGEEATVFLYGDTRGPVFSISRLAVSELSALSANIGHVTAGTITGVLFQTAAAGQRVEISTANTIDFYGPLGKIFDIAVTAGVGGAYDIRMQSTNLFSRILISNNLLGVMISPILSVSTIVTDAINKLGSGSISFNDPVAMTDILYVYDDINMFPGGWLRFLGNQINDIGTDSNRAANIWASGCILNALALRENQNLAAQSGRTILYVESSGDLVVRFPNGTLRTLASD